MKYIFFGHKPSIKYSTEAGSKSSIPCEDPGDLSELLLETQF